MSVQAQGRWRMRSPNEERMRRVLGIDPSQEYVAYAVSKNAFPDRVGFEVGDAQKLHFPDASFDAALACWCSISFPIPRKALLELAA